MIQAFFEAAENGQLAVNELTLQVTAAFEVLQTTEKQGVGFLTHCFCIFYWLC